MPICCSRNIYVENSCGVNILVENILFSGFFDEQKVEKNSIYFK